MIIAERMTKFPTTPTSWLKIPIAKRKKETNKEIIKIFFSWLSFNFIYSPGGAVFLTRNMNRIEISGIRTKIRKACKRMMFLVVPAIPEIIAVKTVKKIVPSTIAVKYISI